MLRPFSTRCNPLALPYLYPSTILSFSGLTSAPSVPLPYIFSLAPSDLRPLAALPLFCKINSLCPNSPSSAPQAPLPDPNI